jgi:ketol-acid reductoisomerase
LLAKIIRRDNEMAEIDFGGVLENVVTSDEFSLEKARKVLENETIAVLGYGIQGPGQALNLRDNGIHVIVDQRQDSPSWDLAVKDGFVPGETLFPLEEAAKKGTMIEFHNDKMTTLASITGDEQMHR